GVLTLPAGSGHPGGSRDPARRAPDRYAVSGDTPSAKLIRAGWIEHWIPAFAGMTPSLSASRVEFLGVIPRYEGDRRAVSLWQRCLHAVTFGGKVRPSLSRSRRMCRPGQQ